MKRLILLILLALSSRAHAVLLDPMLRVKIMDACLARQTGPRANAFCSCVGTKHFRSAKQMPDYVRARADLSWVLKYYAARDARTLARLRSDPDNLVGYDALIGKECRKENRS